MRKLLKKTKDFQEKHRKHTKEDSVDKGEKSEDNGGENQRTKDKFKKELKKNSDENEPDDLKIRKKSIEEFN